MYIMFDNLIGQNTWNILVQFSIIMYVIIVAPLMMPLMIAS